MNSDIGMRHPSCSQIQTALDVLLWLSTADVKPATRDGISHIRHLLHDEIDD